MRLTSLILGTLLGIVAAAPLGAAGTLTLASTTSTLDSGLFDALIPPFERMHGCAVKIIAVGTGQAMRLARDGNAAVLLVHDREAEETFVAEGYGLERLDVMHNDFLLVGPAGDPAAARGQKAAVALGRIAAVAAPFVSRGDDSGTHKKELRLWRQAGVAPGGPWYLESGGGMESTLRIAVEKLAYCLVDRATWLSHRKESAPLAAVVEGDADLFNPYSVIVVSPRRFPWVKAELAKKFAAYIRSAAGQAIIRDFGRERFGAPLFFPDVVR